LIVFVNFFPGVKTGAEKVYEQEHEKEGESSGTAFFSG
jgi:hypothetical protein